MIRKCAVLLGIQHLQKRTGRVSGKTAVHQLVDLIQHHNRAHRSGPLDAVQDTARHCSDIGAAVAADLRLIPDTTQAQADILASECPCDALAKTCLARSGRADQQQNRTLISLTQLHHGKMLDNSLFHLSQTIVVLLQDPFRFCQIRLFHLFMLPGKGKHKVEIILNHAGLCAALRLHVQPFQFLQSRLANLLRHAGLLNTVLIILFPNRAVVALLAQFLLDRLELFPQHLLAVKLVRLV